MTNAGIFLLQGATLAELREQPYEAEHLLQSLIASYPHLLAGNQMDPVSPRRWLLRGSGTSVPSDEGGSGRWAIDHLFLDQEGVPTIVEVKRSTDTRIRREVGRGKCSTMPRTPWCIGRPTQSDFNSRQPAKQQVKHPST